MRKVVYMLIAAAALLSALVYAPSCKKLLSKDVEISDELIFNIGGNSKSAESEIEQEFVLYEGNLEINLYSAFEQAGISKNLIKSFILKKVRIEAVSPKGFDLNLLNSVKLYLGDKSNLAATSSGVENGVLTFTIHKPELFKKLEGEKLHIIMTGTKPVGEVQLKLVTDYLAQVSLF